MNHPRLEDCFSALAQSFSKDEAPDAPLVIQWEIADASRLVFHVMVAGKALTLVPGMHQRPDIALLAPHDVFFALHLGSRTFPEAQESGALRCTGESTLVRQMSRWFSRPGP